MSEQRLQPPPMPVAEIAPPEPAAPQGYRGKSLCWAGRGTVTLELASTLPGLLLHMSVGQAETLVANLQRCIKEARQS
ncbi:hypothetical protein [Hypericibacter sp.]|uniref:hypothetical protein n=1 Tax=Hypericibacter sp. TaxID=2705401 RepID=UPI003D6C878C